tara:strand:+ start:94 stop:579 length:486 start_codon:yes stop_codon:yes gene_type:complete
MKKLSIVIAVVAMLVSTTTQAQLTKKPDNTRGTKTVVEDDEKVKIFGTLLSYTQSGRSVVKIEFDDMVHRISPDKSAAKLCLDIENHRFSSLGEALNVLSTHGWTPELGWTTEDNRNGTITHMIIGKEVDKLMPVYPWKEKSGVKSTDESKSSGKSSGRSK